MAPDDTDRAIADLDKALAVEVKEREQTDKEVIDVKKSLSSLWDFARTTDRKVFKLGLIMGFGLALLQLGVGAWLTATIKHAVASP